MTDVRASDVVIKKVLLAVNETSTQFYNDCVKFYYEHI